MGIAVSPSSATVSAQRFMAKRIAVLGAGPSGLAAAKYLEAENFFDAIDVFEQRGHLGGLWKYTAEDSGDGLFNVPQTNPDNGIERPISGQDQARKESRFLSPIYERLETNIPKALMGYSDTPFEQELQLFPRHVDVQNYLEGYGAKIVDRVAFNAQVLDVKFLSRDDDEQQDEWEVTIHNLGSERKEKRVYNAVIVANGHYAVPYIPAIDGLKEWNERRPRSISHSKYYRSPTVFAGKKVVVVGSSASGLDIGAQISEVCKAPLLQSQRSVSYLSAGFTDNPAIETVGEINRLNPHTREIHFFGGRVEKDVDCIMFCTGYFYSMPFLTSLNPNPITDGARVEHTYKHLLYAPRPSLSFMGLPQKIIPFPCAELQAAVLARLYSGRLSMPSQMEMAEWEQSVIDRQGAGRKFHELQFPRDAEYFNDLYDWAASAPRRDGLVDDGTGKMGRRWGAWEYWARENFPKIRKAFISRGDARKDVKSLRDLGFEFPAGDAPEDARVGSSGLGRSLERTGKEIDCTA